MKVTLYTSMAVLLALQAYAGTGPGPMAKYRSNSNACVIVLHGLGRTSRSMAGITAAMTAAGYLAINLDYPSRQKPIEKLADTVVPKGLERCRAAAVGRIDFITHSMGGIVLRSYLARHDIAELGRVVMLSPPNQGSEASDRLMNNRVYRWYNGPAGQQLGTGPEGLAASLGPVDYQTGIIAGSRHSFFDGWLADIIPGKDDGKVSVERARVAGMADFIVLPYAHSFIMQQKEVFAQTLHFLQKGAFDHGTRP